MKQVKRYPFEVKIDEAKRTIAGYASTFGNKDLVGDIVQEGAFKKTITEQANKIKLLWQHWEPLGKPLHIEEDSKGLYVEAYISKTTLGNDALELAKDGAIDSFSIGYDVIQDTYESSSSTRFLKELKLYEFSLVTFPANEEAAVTGIKSYDQFTEYLRKANGMDVTRLLKEGRKLSDSNRQLILNAIEALENVLDIAEPDDDDGDELETASKSTRKKRIEPLDINIKDLQELAEHFKINE